METSSIIMNLLISLIACLIVTNVAFAANQTNDLELDQPIEDEPTIRASDLKIFNRGKGSTSRVAMDPLEVVLAKSMDEFNDSANGDESNLEALDSIKDKSHIEPPLNTLARMNAEDKILDTMEMFEKFGSVIGPHSGKTVLSRQKNKEALAARSQDGKLNLDALANAHKDLERSSKDSAAMIHEAVTSGVMSMENALNDHLGLQVPSKIIAKNQRVDILGEFAGQELKDPGKNLNKAIKKAKNLFGKSIENLSTATSLGKKKFFAKSDAHLLLLKCIKLLSKLGLELEVEVWFKKFKPILEKLLEDLLSLEIAAAKSKLF